MPWFLVVMVLACSMLGLVELGASARERSAPERYRDLLYLRYTRSAVTVRVMRSARAVLPRRAAATDAAWMPDRRHAVVLKRNRRVSMVDVRTGAASDIVRVGDIPNATLIWSLSASPRGGRLALCVYLDQAPWSKVYTLKIDGSDLEDISRGSGACEPDWGPGGRIVMAIDENLGEARRIISTASDGSDRILLTRLPAYEGEVATSIVPRWAPKGRRVVYAAQLPNQVRPDLWIVRADGSGRRRRLLVTPRRSELRPMFSSNGRAIIYTRMHGGRVGGRGDLYALSLARYRSEQLLRTQRFGEVALDL